MQQIANLYSPQGLSGFDSHILRHAEVAQLVERQISNLNVASSNLVFRSINYKRKYV